MQKTYIIGEIGQNHNGSVEIAKAIIDFASREIKDEFFDNKLYSMDAVKLTKRDLKQELSKSQMERIYDNPNSFGRTYGEHREYLELSDEEHFEVYKYAKLNNMEFVETLCAVGTLSLLKLFTPDRLKVASRDLTNIPLLHAMGETKLPIILSTGMAGKRELDDALETIGKYHSNISILHCVSQYPTEPKNVNLNTILYLLKNYSEFVIGYSDHTIGISTPVAAVAMGAKIVEKHITIDRRLKGTDQAGSLGPDGVYRMIRDIRICDKSKGVEDIFVAPGTKIAKEKLERSIATNKMLKKGDVISENDIQMLSPGDGFKWNQKDEVLGKILNVDVSQNEIIYEGMLANN